jgi:thiol-disulfide isomerase/thioredoxin
MDMNTPKPPIKPHRRIWFAAAAAACAGAGLWTALRQHDEKDAATGTAATASAKPANPPSPATSDVWAKFWATDFPILGGSTQAAKSWQGKPLVLNFWATWCPPCVEELPLLNDFYRTNKAKGWQMIAIAADSESKVKQFLSKEPLEIPISILGADAISWSKDLGNLTGGLPFTVVLNSGGQVAVRKAGQVKAADLQTWLTLR